MGTAMPWTVEHNHPACRAGEWAVVNQRAEAEGRHSIEGCHPTRERALAQQRALYANEPTAGQQAATREVEQMDELRRLFAQIEQKAVTDQGGGEITGLAAVYGNVDLQDDLLETGAFSKSAEDWSRSKAKVPLLDWHGDSISRIIGSVAQLKSVAQGLWFRAGFTHDEQGQRARQLAKDGHLSGVSVGWLPVHQSIQVKDGKAIRAVREARLLEISLTPVPANPQAQLASVKSLGEHKAVSDTPWSQFTEADYTLEQWRRACLIAVEGATDTKAGYKLPVREPSGTLNRNGVHAAAGGHGVGAVQGVSPEKKRAAARALVGLYRSQLGEDPPPSLLSLAGMSSQSSLGYDVWAPELRKALELTYEPAAKAAVHALLGVYNPDNEVAGLADGQPTIPAAATTGTTPAGGTAKPDGLMVTPEQYALGIINPGPRGDAPEGEPRSAAEGGTDVLLAHAQQLLDGSRNQTENLRTSGDLDRLEAEINQALGRDR
jgi:HK97 family phage prohead protease